MWSFRNVDTLFNVTSSFRSNSRNMASLRVTQIGCGALVDSYSCVATLQFKTTQSCSCPFPEQNIPLTTTKRRYTGSGKQEETAEIYENIRANDGKGSLTSWLGSFRLPNVELPFQKWFVSTKGLSNNVVLTEKVKENEPSTVDRARKKLKEDTAKVSEALQEKKLQMKKYEQQVKRSLMKQDEIVNREQHSFENYIQETNQGIASFYDSSQVINPIVTNVDELPTDKSNSALSTEKKPVTKEETDDSPWNRLRKLPAALRFSRTLSTDKEMAKPLIRKDFISKAELDRRTKDLVHNVKVAKSNLSQLKRTEELCKHLLQNPDCRSLAYKKQVLPCLLKLTKTDDDVVRSQAYEALSLIGYVFPPQGRGVRILAIDGGGTRGLVAIETLRMLEIVCNKELNQMFDYVVGSSTGALVAALVVLFRLPIEECEELYIDKSRQMFTQTKLRGSMNLLREYGFHDSPRWETILRERMGEKYMIEFARDPTYPKMSATSTVVNVGKWKTFMFRNYNLPPGVYSDYPGNCKQKVWETIRASSAAPVFYKEFKLGELIHRDGGLLANNPTALAIHECKLLWPNENIQCVVSVGNGRFEPSLEASPTAGGLKDMTLSIIDSATDTEGVHMTMKDMLPSATYYRFNPYLSEESLLDEIRPEKIHQMQQDARMYLRKNHSKLQKAAKQLSLTRLPHQKVMDFARLKIDSM